MRHIVVISISLKRLKNSGNHPTIGFPQADMQNIIPEGRISTGHFLMDMSSSEQTWLAN